MTAIIPIPAFSDNYIWLLREGSDAVVVATFAVLRAWKSEFRQRAKAGRRLTVSVPAPNIAKIFAT